MPVEALRGIPWTLLTYAATRVLTVLTTLALARLLAPADFGLFAMATLGMELLSVFSGLWLAAALIVRPDLDRRGEGTVLTLVIAAGVLLALCLSALAPALAAFFGEPRLAGIVLLLAAVLLVSGVNWFYETLLQRELAFRRRFGALIARTLGFSAVALGLAVAGAGVASSRRTSRPSWARTRTTSRWAASSVRPRSASTPWRSGRPSCPTTRSPSRSGRSRFRPSPRCATAGRTCDRRSSRPSG